jgi:hypothetical protein
VITEPYFSGLSQTGSDAADLAADLATFAAAQDAGTESVEKNCFYQHHCIIRCLNVSW